MMRIVVNRYDNSVLGIPCVVGPVPPHWPTQPTLPRSGSTDCRARSPLETIRWIPPPLGFVKVNTDASVKNNSRAGYGGLLRDSNGVWLVGFCGLLGKDFEPGIGSVVRAELYGIFVGLRTARDRGLTCVIAESDCKVAVDLVNNGAIRNDDRALIIRACRDLLNMGGYYVLRHHKREGNFCADKMAKRGVEGEGVKVIHDDPPMELIPLLIADQVGVGYVRGTRL